MRYFLFLITIISWFLFYSPLYLPGRDSGYNYFQNYTTKEYDRQPQNWCIIQDNRGIIYVGNQGGLLEFDGISWRKIDIPNRTVRSMAKDENGIIHIGGIGEFGFLEPGPRGAVKYQSLLRHLEGDKKKFSDVWKTHLTGEGIYFQARERLFRWDPKQKKIKVWEPGPDSRFYFSFTCRGTLFIRQQKKGLVQMVDDSLDVVPGGKTFAEKKVYMMVPYDFENLLIGTLSNGFFLYDGRTMKPFRTEVDDYLKKSLLYHGIRLSTGDFALATRTGGLVIIGADGKQKEILTTASGINDDNVKYIYEDFRGNLWLCLNNGISKMEYSSPVSIHDSRSNLKGLVLSVTRGYSSVYAGTSYGLYSQTSTGKFHPVPGIPINCWSLLSIGNSVLAATENGVFQVENKTITQNIYIKKLYVLLQSRVEPNRVWVGGNSGLASLYLYPKNGGNRWTLEHEFKNITQEIRTIAEDNKGDLWLGTLTGGVLKINFSDHEKMNDHPASEYNTSNGLPDSEINVFTAAGHVMFATEKGIFRFSEKEKTFIPDLTLGDEFAGGPEGRGIFRIVEDGDKNIWFHSRLTNLRAIPMADGSFNITPTPILRVHVVQVNAIYPDGDTVWFAGNEALIRYDTKINKNYRYDFPTLIRDVLVNGNSLVFDNQKYKHRIDINSKTSFPPFPYEERNFRIQFAAPLFEGESRTQYRCLLEGYENQWSNWSLETAKDYTNLNSGSYTFRVQAKNFYEHLGREDNFQFKVLPPWFKTWWAFLFYALTAFLLVVFIVKWRSGKLKREKQKLEHTVNDRTKEINEKNQQLEDQTFQLKEQSEKLKEMDKVKSRFFANISHEFRTPLTLIMGPLEQMIADGTDKDRQKTFNLMMRNSQRLLALINQLLELSKIESGKMKLQPSLHNIIPFLKGITASFEPVAAKNELDLSFSAEEEDISLYFDPGKLEDIIVNLISNSVKFTPPGGKITVTVSRNRPDETDFPGGSVTVSVGDTGPGIPRDQLEHIFDRFYQSDSTYEHHGKGSGIGLTIAKELVVLHGGKIDVHSLEGKGTEFIIRLPMPGPGVPVDDKGTPADYKGVRGVFEVEPVVNGDAVKTADGKDMDVVPGDLEKNIILVVEDNTDARGYIRDSLEPDYSVVEAKDGLEGIEKAQVIIPDLIISDIMMPGVDGYELCRVLKNDIKTSHIPIVLLTAKASESDIVQGLETGADDYITKPFNTRILSARIKNLIDLRSHLQQTQKREMTLQPVKMDISQIDKKFIKKLKEVIKENIADPDFNIEEMCRKMDMSQPTLYRKIHALTGESPTEFIRSYRLKRGAELLKNNFGTVVEVAFEVGFSSANYFTKCFKKRFHQLPTTYRESVS